MPKPITKFHTRQLEIFQSFNLYKKKIFSTELSNSLKLEQKMKNVAFFIFYNLKCTDIIFINYYSIRKISIVL